MNSKDTQGMPELLERSVWYRLRVMATFLVALWIIASSFWHLAMAVKMAMGPKPQAVAMRLGFPSMQTTSASQVSASTGVAPGSTTGNVAPAVSPTTGASDTNDDDFGVDLKCHWEDGKKTCGVLAGPIAVLALPDWVADWVFCIGAALLICLLIILILAAILEWLCNTDWIKDEGVRHRCNRRRCRRVCFCCNKWFCWLEVFIQWLARLICAWKDVILWLTYLVCVIAGIIILCF